jgi:DICT domain-containing protein
MKRFEPRDVDTNEWTLFCQQQKYSGFSAQKHKREYKKRLKSPARRYVCDALLLERFRCVAFFPRGAVFEHRARFFFVRAIFVREQNE